MAARVTKKTPAKRSKSPAAGKKKAPAKTSASASKKQPAKKKATKAAPAPKSTAAPRRGRPPGIKETRPRRPKGSGTAAAAARARRSAGRSGDEGEQLDLKPTTDYGRKIRAEADLKEHQAEKARLERERLAGSLMTREEHTREIVARIRAVKRGLLSLAERQSPLLVGLTQREIYVALEEAVEGLIREFAGQEGEGVDVVEVVSR